MLLEQDKVAQEQEQQLTPPKSLHEETPDKEDKDTPGEMEG